MHRKDAAVPDRFGNAIASLFFSKITLEALLGDGVRVGIGIDARACNFYRGLTDIGTINLDRVFRASSELAV